MPMRPKHKHAAEVLRKNGKLLADYAAAPWHRGLLDEAGSPSQRFYAARNKVRSLEKKLKRAKSARDDLKEIWMRLHNSPAYKQARDAALQALFESEKEKDLTKSKSAEMRSKQWKRLSLPASKSTVKRREP